MSFSREQQGKPWILVRRLLRSMKPHECLMVLHKNVAEARVTRVKQLTAQPGTASGVLCSHNN